MPAFPWLFDNTVDSSKTADKMRVLRRVGVPYSEQDIKGAEALVSGHSEMDALVAYLQQLGTLIKQKR